MIEAIITLFIGAILGAVIECLIIITIPGIIKNRKEKNRRKQIIDRDKYLKNGKLIKWLRDFYDYYAIKHDIKNVLPIREIGDCKLRIPFLTKPNGESIEKLNDKYKIEIGNDKVLKKSLNSTQKFYIDKALIDHHKSLDHDVWNAPTIYLDYISYSKESILLNVNTCEYYESLTNAIRLENETIACIKTESFKTCNLRRKHYLSIENIEKNLLKPLTLGCMVVFALKSQDGYDIILQTRSEKISTANNVTSVVPTFGLSPFVGNPQNKGLLFYNFIKEYLEELHRMDELIKEYSIKKPADTYYKWLYSRAPAKQLLDCVDFNLYYIGFGFNLINCYPNIGLLAKVDDIKLSENIKETMIANWEIAEPKNRERTIWWINSKSVKLCEMFSKDEFEPGSAFFISSALRFLG